jgi:Protein of unknown function (DUF1236)
MRTECNTVLAGIAALALLAGTGFASAQDSNDQKAKPPQAATQQMNMGPAAGKMSQNAQQQKAAPRAMNKTNKSAQINQRKQGAKASTMARTEKSRMSRKTTAMRERNARAAAQRSRTARQNTAQQQPNGMQKFGAQRPSGFEGLQGNAAGANMQLTEQQRTQIRATVLNGPNVPRAANVNFPVFAGTVVPRGSVRIVPVPSTLVRIDPAWRGFSYFVWNDELVLVNPRDMRIVAVVQV